MADDWKKRRRPDEVPTPVAVAVSDFCRRARTRASAVEVREALAILSEEEDFRVKPLTDGEPPAHPLGPFAVVDILRGTPPQLAAERQKVGYYELARALADARAEPPPLSPAPPAPSAPPTPSAQRPASPAPPLPAPAAPPAAGAAGPGSVQDRIAPRRRRSPGEGLPAPRGRFTRLPAQKLPFSDLLEPAGKEPLEALLVQHGHRIALHRALGERYQGRAGRPPSEGEVMAALEHHGLKEALEARERELVLGSYSEQRGAPGRVAWALAVSPAELGRLTQALGLKEAVEEIKERFRREALAPRPLPARLDLLGRDRYLADLGIKRRYLELVTAELRSLLKAALPGAESLDALAEIAGARHGASPAMVRRAMDQLGLTPEFERLTPCPSTNTPAKNAES
jgi:hypothetical protein